MRFTDELTCRVVLVREIGLSLDCVARCESLGSALSRSCATEGD
jgi:hypothetical protein